MFAPPDDVTVMRVMMKMDILGVDDTERRDKVGDDHEGEEDENKKVEVGGQQGEDEAPKMRILNCDGDDFEWK